MPSSSNTPNSNRPKTRSNSQNDINLDNIKILLENTKKEIISSVKDELNILKDTVAGLSSRIDCLERENNVLRNNYQLLLQQSSKRDKFQPECYADETITSGLLELEQRHARRKNVIIRGLLEQDSGSTLERGKTDLETAKNVLQRIGIEGSMIKEVSRLGRIIPGRPRLLKVKCNKTETQKEILRNAKRLKSIEGYRNIYINKDMTIEEQRRQNDLRKELIRRRAEGEEVIIRNGRIVPRQEFANVGRRQNFPGGF